MYKVLCDGALMCDSRIDDLALINPVVMLEENKAGSFTFTIPPGHEFYDSVLKRKSLIQVYQDEELIFSGVCIEETKDFYKQKKIYCEGELTFFNDSIQRPKRYQGVTVRGLLEQYVANHNAQVEESKQFTVGIVTVKDTNDYLYCYTNMESTMQSLKEDLVDDLGGFFRIRHVDGIRYIDYLADSQNTNSQVIKIGKNLMDFTANIDSSDIATTIIPLGARLDESPVEGLELRLNIESVNDGLDYVYSADAVASYGWIYKTVEWDEVTTASALKTKGEQYLSDIQFENMVIQAKAVDLHLTDKQIEQFKLSDKIRVVSAPHGLDRYFRLTKQTIYLNNPEKNIITLGKDERITLSEKSNQANAEIKKAIENIVPANTILKSAAENATALITSAMGGYVYKTNNELYIMDTDRPETATKVWRWNINGLGYSSTGINGKYDLAMTMDGRIVADFISSGTMYADRIKGGTLSLGYENNCNGLMQVYDANGKLIGFWNNTGIRIQSADVSNMCDINDGYIYFFNESNIHGGIGAENLITAGQSLKSLIVRSYGDVIDFSHNNTPYYVINPKKKELTDNKYTDNHLFIGSVRSTGSFIATDVTATGVNTANKFKLSNGVEIYPGTWLDLVSVLISSNLYIYGTIGCSKDINSSGTIYGNKANITEEVTAGSFSTEGTINAGKNIYTEGDVYAYDLVCEDSVYVNGVRVQSGSYDSSDAILIQGGFYAYGPLGCSGTKYRVVDTEHYGKVGMNAFETAEAYFSDIGSGKIGESGEVTVRFDDVFSETIDTDARYHIFITQTSEEQVEWVEKQDGYFVVHGEPMATFDWMLCCKQKGYSDVRLAAVNIVEPKKKESEGNG